MNKSLSSGGRFSSRLAAVMLSISAFALAPRTSLADDPPTAGELIKSAGPKRPAPAVAAEPFGIVEASGLRWRHLSTRNGDLPLPGKSTEQTGAIVGDLAGDGVNGFVLSFRKEAPALVWYRKSKSGWDRYVIDKSFLTVEAGGVIYDIDGDGKPDILFGNDWQGTDIWWWKNPGPPYRPDQDWARYTAKHSGAKMHHDQIIGDFKHTGKPQLVYWNQKARTLFIADIPANPTQVTDWPATAIFTGQPEANPKSYPEGCDAADVDSDGQVDLLAGNYWFKYLGNDQFKAIKIGDMHGRIAAAHLIKDSRYPQIVISSGDGIGPLKWYECKGNPENSEDWIGHDLLDRPMSHGHSLQIADVDGDGSLDIFTAEMAKWTEKRPDADDPHCEAFIFYGDGQGHFRKTIFATGVDFHEARLADLDGDGRLDILDKPYNWNAPCVEVWLQLPPGAVQPAADTQAPTQHQKVNVGVQLYSVRAQMKNDFAGALTAVHNMGVTDVEAADLFGKAAADFRAELDKQGLKATGAHFQWPRFNTDIDGVIRDAKTLGCEYVTMPWIPHKGTFTIEQAQSAADKFNEWGKKCADAGLKFTYHPHGYEFRPYENGMLFDVMLARTDPRYVNYELDIFWAYDGGADPVALMRKYPDRFPLMHLKDMRKGVKTPNYSAHEDVESDVALGVGQMDIPAILAEAEKIGVKHYYIEDESSKSLEQIPQSITYVRNVGF
jgi:sugar phosphate isomerase/epimerase